MLGAVRGNTAIFGLPGNPVSVMVTSRRIACPVLQSMSGLAPVPAAEAMVKIENPSDKRLDLWWHRPAFRTGPASARILQTMGSGDVPAVAASDGFVELPPGESGPGPWPFFAWSIA
jgi:molybdopterin molybdotransferase